MFESDYKVERTLCGIIYWTKEEGGPRVIPRFLDEEMVCMGHALKWDLGRRLYKGR